MLHPAISKQMGVLPVLRVEEAGVAMGTEAVVMIGVNARLATIWNIR